MPTLEKTDVVELAGKHLPGDYTIEHRMFTDGDERWVCKHSIGHAAGDRVEIELWAALEMIIVKYYEHDIRRTCDSCSLEEWSTETFKYPECIYSNTSDERDHSINTRPV